MHHGDFSWFLGNIIENIALTFGAILQGILESFFFGIFFPNAE